MSTELRQLSERETEVLQLVAAGLSNQQIANRLGVSINTVKVHLRNVFSKIGAASRTEATMYAVREGIVVLDRPAQAQAATLPEETLLVEAPDEVSAGALPEAVEWQEAQITASHPEPETVQLTTIAAPTPVETLPTKRRRILRVPAIVAVVILGLSGALGSFQWYRTTSRTGSATQNSGREIQWNQLPAVKTPRAGFGLASIGELIYAIGGENQSGVLNNIERYDARSGTWTNLSKKPTPVTDVRAALLGGKLYVPGGRRSADPKDISNVFERYDPRTESWEKLPNLPAPRSGYALATLEGKLYLFGGWDGQTYRKEVWEYEPERATWRARSPMPVAGGFGDAAAVEDSIYVLGGENETGPLSNNQVYVPAQEGGQPWTRRAPMPEPRVRFSSAVALASIYVLGGSSGQETPVKYDAHTDNWQPFTPPPQAVGSQAGVVLRESKLMTLGGKVGPHDYSAQMQEFPALYVVVLPGTYSR